MRHGGTAVVQDVADALYDIMSNAALEQVPGAVVRRAREIGPVLMEITGRPLLDGHRPTDRLAYEVRVSRGDAPAVLKRDPPGAVVGMSCPDCSGPLFDLGGTAVRASGAGSATPGPPKSLAAAQDDTVERALYAALRALEDKVSLSHRVTASAEATGATRVAARSRQSEREAQGSAAVLRRLLVEAAGPTDAPDGSRRPRATDPRPHPSRHHHAVRRARGRYR